MSSISSVYSSVYESLIQNVGATSTRVQHNSSNSNRVVAEGSNLDLSNYYTQISSGDLIELVGKNVEQSVEDLDNAMITAIENGFSVHDAVNIQLAKTAYEANCQVLKTTFELAI